MSSSSSSSSSKKCLMIFVRTLFENKLRRKRNFDEMKFNGLEKVSMCWWMENFICWLSKNIYLMIFVWFFFIKKIDSSLFQVKLFLFEEKRETEMSEHLVEDVVILLLHSSCSPSLFSQTLKWKVNNWNWNSSCTHHDVPLLSWNAFTFGWWWWWANKGFSARSSTFIHLLLTN